MSHIKTLVVGNLAQKAELATEQAMGCGECQTSCQSACKTSCTVANQACDNSALTRVFRTVQLANKGQKA